MALERFLEMVLERPLERSIERLMERVIQRFKEMPTERALEMLLGMVSMHNYRFNDRPICTDHEPLPAPYPRSLAGSSLPGILVRSAGDPPLLFSYAKLPPGTRMEKKRRASLPKGSLPKVDRATPSKR